MNFKNNEHFLQENESENIVSKKDDHLLESVKLLNLVLIKHVKKAISHQSKKINIKRNQARAVEAA